MNAPAQTGVKRRKFPWWVYWLILAVIVLFMISPIIPVSWAESIARNHGCTANPSYVIPCVVDGKDIGRELYDAAYAGYYFLVTAPLGLLAIFIWLVSMLIHRLLWGQARKRAAAQP